MTRSDTSPEVASVDDLQRLRVLVVEDSAADARLLEEAIRDAGASGQVELTIVASLGEAEAIIGGNTFDCVLLDLGLPDATGHDNVQRLRAANRWQTIVIMTGLDSEEVALGNLQRGAQDYLVKGRTEGDELLRIIRRAIERNRVLSEVDRLREEQYFQATHDGLTGLPNRQLFMERARQALSHADRQHQIVVLGYLDLDGFKDVNDRFGHAVGDSLLRAVARVMRAALRDSEMLARIGGDEFLVLLSPMDDAGHVERAIKRVRDSVAGIKEIDGHDVSIEVSAGLAHYPKDAPTLDLLIVRADQAMYDDKKVRRRIRDGGASEGTARHRTDPSRS